jgi:hypothetical protein
MITVHTDDFSRDSEEHTNDHRSQTTEAGIVFARLTIVFLAVLPRQFTDRT